MTARTVIALVLAAAAGTSQADILSAHNSYTYYQTVNVTQIGVHNGDIPTVTFEWTRSDSPGPGIDASIPVNFKAYCVEIGQTVASGTDYVYTVQSPAEHGYSANQALLLGRLWSSFQGSVNDTTTSAAFQIAVWELAFDSGADLSGGNFTGNNPSGIVALSQSWLNAVNDAGYAGGVTSIRVLHSESVQDQLIPTPGSIALLGLGLSMFRRPKR